MDFSKITTAYSTPGQRLKGYEWLYDLPVLVPADGWFGEDMLPKDVAEAVLVMIVANNVSMQASDLQLDPTWIETPIFQGSQKVNGRIWYNFNHLSSFGYYWSVSKIDDDTYQVTTDGWFTEGFEQLSTAHLPDHARLAGQVL